MFTTMKTYQLLMGPVATQKVEPIGTTSVHLHTGGLHTSINAVIVSIRWDYTISKN
jgi:hypothetical protein